MKRTEQNSLLDIAIQMLVQLTVTGVIALIGWLVSIQAWQKWGEAGLTGAIVAFVVLTAVGNEAHKRWSVFRTYYPRYAGNFVVRDKILSYTYTADGELTFSRKMRLQAVRSGQHCFLDRYLWTGKAPAIPEAKKAPYEIRLVSRPGIWNFFEVDFGRTINKGETVEYEVIQTTKDENFDSGPFFSTSIEEPTYKLEFRLKLDPQLGVTEITKEVLRGIESHYPYKVEIDALDDDGEYKWVVNRPRFHRHYRLHWRWPKPQVSAEHVIAEAEVLP